MNTEQTRKSVISAILKGERESANRMLEEYAALSSYSLAMHEVLEPVLEEIGSRWSEENISLAQGYIAGKVAEDILLKIHTEETNSDNEKETTGPVILGNIEDDYHSLGRKLVSVFLRSAGWHVIDMGNDVLAEEFVNKAVEKDARVIGISAMMYTTAGNIRKVHDELVRRNLSGRIKLAVGGAVFKLRPELKDEVGGDGTVASGFLAPALFKELWECSLREVPM